MIIAGAGSGKTTVMAARVVWLVGTGEVRPEEVLGLTFTRKAAAELSLRVRSALERAGVVPAEGVDAGGEQLIMTYDAFAARLVAEHGLRLGYETDPTMITGATRYRLASRVVREAAGPFEHISRLRPATVTERVLRLDADLQQHLVSVPDLDPHAHAHLLELAAAPLNRNGNVYADLKKAAAAAHERLELASLVVAYQQLKQRLGVVEFADQMAIAARLAQEVPAVSELVRSAYRVVLLDEYQDTSAAQAKMLRGLFSGGTPSAGMGHPVTAVGDPFQAIYGWRGAAASNITSFAEQFRTAQGRPAGRFALTVNRRSGQTILDVANVLSRPLRADTAAKVGAGTRQGARVAGTDKTAGMGFLVAPEDTPPGVVRAATFDDLAGGGRLDRRSGDRGPNRRYGGPLGRYRGADPPERRHRAALRRADRTGRAGRDRRSGWPAGAARGDGRDRHPAGARRRHRQPGRGPTAHRAALADRSARPGAARTSGPGAGPGRGRRTSGLPRPICWPSSRTRSPTSTRPRWSACWTRWRARATCPTRGQPWSGSPCWPPSWPVCAGTRVSRCWTCAAGWWRPWGWRSS